MNLQIIDIDELIKKIGYDMYSSYFSAETGGDTIRLRTTLREGMKPSLILRIYSKKELK